MERKGLKRRENKRVREKKKMVRVRQEEKEKVWRERGNKCQAAIVSGCERKREIKLQTGIVRDHIKRETNN